jgi:hypothetical protein
MCSRSYIFVSEITDVVFASDNIVLFLFPMKKYESESDGAFRRPFSSLLKTIPRSVLFLNRMGKESFHVDKEKQALLSN